MAASSSAPASDGSPRSTTALGVPFAARGQIADEHLAALREIWASEDSTFHGHHVDFTDAVSLPKPHQIPGPPIHIGGESDAALRRVARYGDGWFGWNMTPAQLEHGLDRLATHLAGESFVDGRRRTLDDVTIQVGLRFLGDLDALADLVDAFASAGASRVVASLPIRPAELDDRLAAIAGALGVQPRRRPDRRGGQRVPGSSSGGRPRRASPRPRASRGTVPSRRPRSVRSQNAVVAWR